MKQGDMKTEKNEAHDKDSISESFDVINPLQYIGVDTVRERAEKWFSSFQSSIGYEVQDLSIMTGETVALGLREPQMKGRTVALA
jgi:hypothetical protein